MIVNTPIPRQINDWFSLCFFSLCSLCLCGSFSSAQPVGDLARKHGWTTNYGAAKAEAKRTGKPIFLVFRCEP